MNFGDPSAIGTEMAHRFVMSGANLPPLLKIGLNMEKIMRPNVSKNTTASFKIKLQNVVALFINMK